MSNETIKDIILKWIGYNFGSQEMEDPCYNINMLSRHLEKELKNKLYDIIDDLLQDCFNETVGCEDIKDLTDEELQLIYDNVKLFTLKLKDRIGDE